jgi:hypothetical protein
MSVNPWPTQAAARPKTLYGQAFPLHELLFMRDGAGRRGLHMNILLDQVLDGAEFEELVMIRPTGRPYRAATLWRTAHCIVAQAAGAEPKAFGGIRAAMDHVLASLPGAARARRRFSWRDLFSRTDHLADATLIPPPESTALR